MKPAQETWSADRVREEIKRGRKPFVLSSNGEFHNLTIKRAMRLDGDLIVRIGPHEIVVVDNFQKKTG